MPPCTLGCSVFTRPSSISGIPVTSEMSFTARPASRNCLAVLPVEMISTPHFPRPRAKSTIPLLSVTLMSARAILLTVPSLCLDMNLESRLRSSRSEAFGLELDLALFHFHDVLHLIALKITLKLLGLLLDESLEGVRPQTFRILAALLFGFHEGGEKLVHFFGLLHRIAPVDSEAGWLFPLGALRDSRPARPLLFRLDALPPQLRKQGVALRQGVIFEALSKVHAGRVLELLDERLHAPLAVRG